MSLFQRGKSVHDTSGNMKHLFSIEYYVKIQKAMELGLCFIFTGKGMQDLTSDLLQECRDRAKKSAVDRGFTK